MENTKIVDKRESIRVVTDNSVITAIGLPNLSLNARKLLYVAIAQCRKADAEFYTYQMTPAELAEMWGIDKSNVYRMADKITDELMKMIIKQEGEKKTSWNKKHLFESCEYDENSVISFRIHADMADLLLGVKKNFTKPLLWDFMRMKSPYSMSIWHIMQREMKSFKPDISTPIVFEISLDELRAVTGTQNKLKQISEFKTRVLDKAIAEIERNCLVNITYTNIKRGRTIVGFEFTAENYFGTMKIENLSLRQRQRIRRATLARKRNDGTITSKEMDELRSLDIELFQIEIEDYENNEIS